VEPFKVPEEELKEYVVEGNYRPQMPETIPKTIAELIRSCWQQDPEKRPTISELIRACTLLLE